MKRYCLAIIFLAAPSYAYESGAAFLRIHTDARAVSMSSAYTALAQGASALSYNPAGMSYLNSMEAGFSHTNWLMNSRHDYIGFAMPVGHTDRSYSDRAGSGWGVVGLGLTRLTNASIEVRNADRSLAGDFDSYDQVASIGMAKIFGMSRFGVGVKYIQSVIADETASAAAVDLGYDRQLSRLPVSLGVSVQNLGTPMKYISQRDPLPLSVSAGLAVNLIPGFNVAADVGRLIYDKKNRVSVGTEYMVLSAVALRGGYLMNSGSMSGQSNGFSLGAGLTFWRTSLDYAVTPYGDLGNTQKITIKKQF